MTKQTLSSLLLLFIIAATSCDISKKEPHQFDRGTEVADTIIYPVDVINLDTADTWKDIRIKRLQQKELTDLIFEALYNHNARALDYYSREEIPAEEIKEMEESGELNRDEMAQLQFEESWFFNPSEARMTKEVQAALLAWPVYDNQGEFQAYKAGFIIELNP